MEAEEPAIETKPVKRMSLKRKFIADGVFQAELNEFLCRALGKLGYAGLEIRVTNVSTEIRIKATKFKEVIGQNNRKIKELISLVQKRFNYDNEKNKVDLVAKPVVNRGLTAAGQAESLKFKLLSGYPVRVVAHSTLRFIMRNGAKGVEIIISGKLRGQRAKSQKYKAGFRISTGQPKLDYIDECVRHVELRQGILGVKIMIMLPHDPTGEIGPSRPLPDHVEVLKPKETTEEE